MVIQVQLVDPAVCFSDIYDVFLRTKSFWAEGGGEGVSDFFWQRNSEKKYIIWFFRGGVGLEGVGVG